MKKILILLSTYNGERFLREQLDSLFNQTLCDVKVLVRDDGSSDSTVAILSEYQQRNPEKIDIIEGKNRGWRKSFFELMGIAKEEYQGYDYFAFADQDDIWQPDKLKMAIKHLLDLSEGPNLYCSNQYYYKNGENFGLIRKEKTEPSYKSCLVRNYATGCTIVFNRALLNLINREFPTIEMAHDYWLYMVAVLCGHVYVDENAYICYRQHDSNQIGSRSSWSDVWKRRLKGLKMTLSEHRVEKQAKELLRIFSQDMYPEGRKAVSKLAYYRINMSNKIKLLSDNGYTLGRKSNDRWMKVKIALGIL